MSDVVLGWESKVVIGGRRLGVRTGRIHLEADKHETGDTETGRRKRFKGGRVWADWECQMYEDPAVSPHSDPLFINEGDDLDALSIYSRGVDSPGYVFHQATCFTFEDAMDVNNPNDIRFSGSGSLESRPGDPFDEGAR